MFFWLCGVTIVCAIVFGGSTHSGFVGDVIVQLIAIPPLTVSFAPAFFASHPRRSRARLALAVCVLCAAIVALQILPLPFSIWSGGMPSFADADIGGLPSLELNWTTLSITPQATWAAAASLIVPLSIFAAALQLGLRDRIMLCWVILGAGAISLMLGFLQMAQGPSSDLRFYEYTNPTEAVGFFANRNHFAALLNVTLIVSALWFYPTIEGFLDDKTLRTRSILWFLAAAAFLVTIVAGLVMARSRAGVILAMAALAGIVMMAVTQRRAQQRTEAPRHRKGLRRISLAVVSFAVLFALQTGLGGLAARFESSLADDLRIPLAVTTFKTALKALPFGTGLGSFVNVYGVVENPEYALAAFANRAHNDLAEILLETGLVGAVILILFLGWLGRRAYTVWMRPADAPPPGQALLQRASTLIIAVLLLHSLVDYPLRTTALGALFAFFCASLLAPVEESEIEAPTPRPRRREPRRLAEERAPGDLRKPDMTWPQAWRRKSHNQDGTNTNLLN